MDFEDELKKSLDLTRKMLEEQYKDNPIIVEKMIQIFDNSISSYTTENKEAYPELSKQKIKLNREKLNFINRELIEHSLPNQIPDPFDIEFSKYFSRIEFERLTYGLNPSSMEEKWIIIYDNEQIYFYRSWPPYNLIFRIKLLKNEDCFYFSKFEISLEFLNTKWNSSEYSVKLLNYLIERLLLGRLLNFPFPDQIKDKTKRAIFRHSLVGSSIANDEK